MGVVAVTVNLGGVIDALIEEIDVEFDTAADFIGDAADKPVVAASIFAGDDETFADFAKQRYRFFPVYWYGADKLEGLWVELFVDVGAVGRHVHGGIDGDEVGELAGDGGGGTFGEVGDVENARGVIHAAGEEASEGEDAGVGGAEGAAFVFLATGAFTGHEVWPGALDAGAFDGLVDI